MISFKTNGYSGIQGSVTVNKGKVKHKKKILFILFFLLSIGSFFIPKLNRIAWRVVSIGEFEMLAISSKFLSGPDDSTNGLIPKLASHRGVLNENSPGDSEKSIALAAQNNFRYIEVDVSFSKEFIPFIFHDSNLKHMTNLDRLTSEVSWDEIQKLKLPDGQRIISLKYFLSEYAPLFDGVILDIKGENNYFNEKAYGVIDVINSSGYSKNIYVIGRPCGVLSVIKKLNPNLKVGCEDQGVLYNYITGKDLISLHYATQYSFLEYVFAKKFNLMIILWTINDPQTLKSLEELRNTIILTDLHVPYYK